MDNCIDRESYSLAAGLALGLVMLGVGSRVSDYVVYVYIHSALTASMLLVITIIIILSIVNNRLIPFS